MDLTNFEDKIPPKKQEAEVKKLHEEIKAATAAPATTNTGRWRTTVEVRDGYNSINESQSRPKVEMTGPLVRIATIEFEVIVSADNLLNISIHQA